MTANASSKKCSSKTLIASTIVGLGLLATATDAQAYGKKMIDDERAREAAVIERGRYTGELTRREYRDLLAEQTSIRAMERRALADGHISRREYREIAETQRNASRHIYQETHDRQVSFWRKWLYRHRY